MPCLGNLAHFPALKFVLQATVSKPVNVCETRIAIGNTCGGHQSIDPSMD